MRVEKPAPPQPPIAEKNLPQPTGKIVFLGCLVVVLTALFWLTLDLIFAGDFSFVVNLATILSMAAAFLAFSLMFAIVGITEMVVSNKLFLLLIVGVAALTHFLFFPISLFSVISVILLILAFLYWKREIRLDLQSRLKFTPRRVVQAGLSTAIGLAILAVSFTYYGFLVSGPNGSSRVVDSLVRGIADTINKILPTTYPEYKPSMTLDAFIAGTSGISGAGAAGIGAGISEQIINEAVKQAQGKALTEARQSFLDAFHIQANGTDTMDTVVQKIVRRQISQYVDPYVKFLPALFALALFFLLRIFTFLYKALIETFSTIVFTILKWMRFLSIEKIQVEAERVALRR